MNKIAITSRSQQLIQNYLTGGAALGGSAALLTSLLNYMKMLKQDGDPQTSGDDDTLYVNVDPAKKVAAQALPESSGRMDMAAGGLAIGGGMLATVGSYALVRKLYQQMKLKQLQAELDNAQQTFLTQSEAEAQQKAAALMQPQQQASTPPPAAGKPMGLAEATWSAPVAMALLSAIAAGALTNHALDKTFPRVKPPANKGPKRVVVRRKPVQPLDNENEADEEKIAYEQLSPQDVFDDGMEFLATVVMGNKAASEGELADLVHAVAQGRHDEFVNNMLELGYDTAIDTIKGASLKPLAVHEQQLALSVCTKSAALSPVFGLLVAMEYSEMAPRFTKIASLQSDEDKERLIKIAGVIGRLSRAALFTNSPIDFSVMDDSNDKAASVMPSLSELLQYIQLQKANGEGAVHQPQGMDAERREGIDENEDMLNTEDSISSTEEKNTNDSSPFAEGQEESPDIINELNDDDDLIDKAMSQTTTPAKAVASQI